MNKKWKLNKENAMIIILAGILCLVVIWPTSEQDSENSSDGGISSMLERTTVSSETISETALNIYVENQEQRLKNILEQMDGVGDVRVMIRAKASKEYVVEKDLTTDSSIVNETDAQGGKRQSNDTSRTESSLYTKDMNGNDIPWVIKELEPEIEGVVIAAEGGGSEKIAGEITQAVQVLFDIPVHKIKVVKMKSS